MGKTLLFYMVDEHVDVDKYCKRKGLIPYKFVEKVLDGKPFKQAVQYIKGECVYQLLEGDIHSYTGCMFAVMRMPELPYEVLLKTALTSKYFDERAGATGLILKKHSGRFRDYLIEIYETDVKLLKDKKHIRRMVKFIKDNTRYENHLEEIIPLCEKIHGKIKIENGLFSIIRNRA
jgi:hypothetical protein